MASRVTVKWLFLYASICFILYSLLFLKLRNTVKVQTVQKEYYDSNGAAVNLPIEYEYKQFEWSEYLGKSVNIDCSAFLANNSTAFAQYKSNGKITLEKEPVLAMKCSDIRQRITRLNYTSDIENPLAVARNVYKDYYLQEILLAQSYSPSNAFCYAMDTKSSNAFKSSMRQMASCLQNVIVLNETFNFDSGGHFQNRAHYACMRELVSFPKWTYVILLQNAEIFIKTPQEISKILGMLNGAPLFSSAKVWDSRVPKANITAKSMGLFRNETNKTKEQLETVFTYRKSAVSMVLPRGFIHEIVFSLNMTRFLTAFNNEKVFAIDEYLFPTLVSAYFLKLPDQVENQCLTHHVLRYAHWVGKESQCRSHKKRHSICLLGVEYLEDLRDSYFILANKVWPEFDFGAIVCIDQMLNGKNGITRDWKKITDFYSNVPHVRERNLRSKGAFNIATFKC